MTLFFMAPITKHFPIKLAVNACGGAPSRPPDHMAENGSGKSVAFLLPVVLSCFTRHQPLADLTSTYIYFSVELERCVVRDLSSSPSRELYTQQRLIEAVWTPQIWGYLRILWHCWHHGYQDPVPPCHFGSLNENTLPRLLYANTGSPFGGTFWKC